MSRKSETGRTLEGRTYDEFPDFFDVKALESKQRLSFPREVDLEYREKVGR